METSHYIDDVGVVVKMSCHPKYVLLLCVKRDKNKLFNSLNKKKIGKCLIRKVCLRYLFTENSALSNGQINWHIKFICPLFNNFWRSVECIRTSHYVNEVAWNIATVLSPMNCICRMRHYSIQWLERRRKTGHK